MENNEGVNLLMVEYEENVNVVAKINTELCKVSDKGKESTLLACTSECIGKTCILAAHITDIFTCKHSDDDYR